MNFVDQLNAAKAVLKEQTRLSVRALGRQLELGGDDLDEIVEELVDIQQVAKLDGKALVWAGDSPKNAPSPQPSPEGRGSEHASPLPPGEGAPQGRVRDYTPKHLADKILASRSAMEGEKKQVTVLFCDVAGSMDLAEALGPEAWHNTLNEFFKILTSAIHEFEGTVNQYTGDGIMALFGAPIAAEDHARRACMAALAIQEKLSTLRNKVETEHGEQFAARIGINSGEVVVGKIGDDLRMDYTAQGQVVGIAARLEALASANGILLSAYTENHISGYFDLASQGEKTIKGLKKPLEVFQLGDSQTETTRFDVSRRQGLTKFIGREADMATLQAALTQAQAGNGQVVGVVAEAGTGKSRLCYEFLETCRAQGMNVIEGHALSHGKNIPFMPMLQVFKAYYGITEEDDDRTAREKVAGRLIMLDAKFRDFLPVQFEFFGIADPDAPPLQIAPEAKQRQLINVLRQIVQGADPNIGNIIAYIEDLHWLDDGSEVFLEEWVDALAGSNSFLLVNFRPEYRAEWMQKTYYRQIPLAPLSPEEVQEMLVALLGPEPSVSGLADIIFKRTGGNPFFCEEVVKSLQESGVLEGQAGQYVLTGKATELDIPASVHAVLAARIDRLSDDEKSLLQTAAVIGRVFSRVLLAEVSDLTDAQLDRSLAALKAGEFIFQRSHGLGEEYIFKHALTQEVAVGSQLSDKLKATHTRVAQAVEGLNQDNLGESAPLIAHHYEQAGEALTAAQWYMRAADYICPADIMQGMRQMQAALRLTENLPASMERDTCRLGALAGILMKGAWRIDIGRERLEEFHQEALHLLAKQGDADTEMVIRGGYAAAIGMAYGEVEAWARLVDETLEELGSRTSTGASIVIMGNQCYSRWCLGLLQRTEEAATEAKRLIDGDYSAGIDYIGFSPLAQIQANQPYWQGLMKGDLRSAESELIQNYEQFRDSGFLEESLWNMATISQTVYLRGMRIVPDSKLAALISSARQQIEERASDYSRYIVLYTLTRLELTEANAPNIVLAYEDILAGSRANYAAQERVTYAISALSEAQLLAGQTEQAAQTARDGIAHAVQQTVRLDEIYGQLALIRALLAGDYPAQAKDEILQALSRSDALIEETGAKALEPHVIEQRARLAAVLGDADSARKQLEAAHKLYVKVGADGHAERLGAELKS